MQDLDPEYIIRGAVMDDMEFLLRDGLEFWMESGAAKIAPFRYRDMAMSVKMLMDSDMACVLIATKGGVPVGSAALFCEPIFFNEGHLGAQERWLWVNPAHRSNGVGKMLVDQMEKEAMLRAADVLFVMSLSDPAAAKLYKSIGYEKLQTMFIKRLSQLAETK